MCVCVCVCVSEMGSEKERLLFCLSVEADEMDGKEIQREIERDRESESGKEKKKKYKTKKKRKTKRGGGEEERRCVYVHDFSKQHSNAPFPTPSSLLILFLPLLHSLTIISPISFPPSPLCCFPLFSFLTHIDFTVLYSFNKWNRTGAELIRNLLI